MKLFFTLTFFCFFSLNMWAQSCDDSEYLLSEYMCGEYMCREEICETVAILPLSIFPNPMTDFFEVKNVEDNIEGVIFNSLGQFIRLVNIRNIVPVGDLPQGIYFLKLKNQTVKFIKT